MSPERVPDVTCSSSAPPSPFWSLPSGVPTCNVPSLSRICSAPPARLVPVWSRTVQVPATAPLSCRRAPRP